VICGWIEILNLQTTTSNISTAQVRLIHTKRASVSPCLRGDHFSSRLRAADVDDVTRFTLIERLEPRKLMAAVYPTAVEQLEVELINRARANPATEAARYGIDLNEGLVAGTISTASKPPLAINPYVTDAARKHSQWMIDQDLFSHTGASGSDPKGRMTSAGYAFVMPFSAGENIGYRSQFPSVPDPVATAARIHQDLFVDAGISGRGHRKNILSTSYKEVGPGVVSGVFNAYNAVMVTIDFAASGAGHFLTGVAYTDAVTKDNFYTPGEGIAGVTVSATRASDGATFTTTSWTSGGYSLKLAPGTYAVRASGTALGGAVAYGNVVISTANVKVDFRPAPTGSIKGIVFNDLNKNGAPDAGEPVFTNLIVYVDKNRNGVRDAGEKYARTTSLGTYRFATLPDGTYRIRHAVPAGFTVLAPSLGYYDVKILGGRAVGGRNFADTAV